VTDEPPFMVTNLVELHVDNFEPIKEYYLRLGFQIAWERPPEGFKGYVVLTFGQQAVCFWAGNDQVYAHRYFSQFPNSSPRGFGVELVYMVADIDAYYHAVKDFANVIEPLRLKAWGLKDFRCKDPAGYYLRFTTFHNILDPKYAVE
jgi:hypothetical protein